MSITLYQKFCFIIANNLPIILPIIAKCICIVIDFCKSILYIIARIRN